VRLAAVFILSFFVVVPSQQPPPSAPPAGQPARDVVRRADAAGTSVIRGRVVAADTGNPIRRASVTLTSVSPTQSAGSTGRGMRGAAPPVQPPARSGQPPREFGPYNRPRQVTTNAQGVFEFTGISAGTYRLVANSSPYLPQYLGMSYGAKKPSGPFSVDSGQSISLQDGESFEKALIALPRGGVIAGRVTDENTEPLARVQVYTVFYPAGAQRGMRTGAGAQTDDLGQFRLYGLLPGDYVVAAEARGNTWAQPNAPPETEEDKVGFLTTYFPGTTDEIAAQRVRIGAGSETPGIEIRLGQGRLYRVAGFVTDSQGRPGTRVNGQLMRRANGFSGGPGFGFSTDERGQFEMRNIPAGSYRLVVQAMRGDFGPGGRGPDSEPGEMASVPLTVADDLEGVGIMTMAGTTIKGQVVIEQAAAPPSSGQIRVMPASANPEETVGLRMAQPVLVEPDLTFTLKGLMGEWLLRTMAPNLYVKSITVGADDITETPREFKATDRVVITLTSRASTLEGSVTDGKGTVPADTGVVVFSEDKSSWHTSSTRTHRAITDGEGHFRVPGLMPGRYLVVAVPRERLSVVPGEALFFEQMAKEAVPVVIGEDEQRKVDLKVVESSGGG
jgi:Carboxypeptidase regulatory-like domain